jgi:hypothetical protein
MKKVVLPIGLVLLIATNPVWGKKNPPHTPSLPYVVNLNGAQVPAVSYELTWETQGSAARATLLKEGRFVATAPGAWVKNGVKYPEDEALVLLNPEGSRSLVEIRIGGTARAIVFDPTGNTVHYSATKR